MRSAALLLIVMCAVSAHAADTFLGIFVQSKPAYAVYNEETRKGMVIASVSSGSPADRAGVREGDLMLTLNGQSTPDEKSIAAALADTKPGQRIECLVWRDDEPLVLDVTLADRRKVEQPVNKFSVSWSAAVALGARLENLTPQMRDFFAVDHGVLVSHVEEYGESHDAGLRAGDVLLAVEGEPVDSIEAATAALFYASDAETVALTVNRKGETLKFDVPIDRASAWTSEYTLTYDSGDRVIIFGPEADAMPVVDMEMMDNWLRTVVPDYPGALTNEDLQARLEELEREMEQWLKEWESR